MFISGQQDFCCPITQLRMVDPVVAAGIMYMYVCVCVCMCVRARAYVCMSICMYTLHRLTLFCNFCYMYKLLFT